MKLRRPWYLALLVLALIAVVVSWIRSYRSIDISLIFLHDGAAQAVVAQEGVFFVCLSNVSLGPDVAYSVAWLQVPAGAWDRDAPLILKDVSVREKRMSGFSVGVSDGHVYEVKDAWCAYISFPHWSLAAVVGALIGEWFLTARRRRKWGMEGRCHHCGYDLRASIDRCPECGTAFTPSPSGRGLG